MRLSSSPVSWSNEFPQCEMTSLRVLVLPDWQRSDPTGWPGLWAAAHGHTLVEQHDVKRPLRGDWLIQLEEAVLEAPGQVVLVARGLACALVAAWSLFTPQRGKVRAALLVAPLDLNLATLREVLPSWQPQVRQPLPFQAVVVASADEPYGSASAAQALAKDWGARWVPTRPESGPICESAAGDWPEGRALLNELMKD